VPLEVIKAKAALHVSDWDLDEVRCLCELGALVGESSNTLPFSGVGAELVACNKCSDLPCADCSSLSSWMKARRRDTPPPMPTLLMLSLRISRSSGVRVCGASVWVIIPVHTRCGGSARCECECVCACMS
jgi:hypothetical protein